MPKREGLDAALAKIRKDRDLRIASLSDLEEVESISTGNIAIDAVTGVWGFPKGRLIELFGLPMSGKTTTALQAAAVAQRAGMNVLFLDYEHALDPTYCAALGIDTAASSFLFTQPDSMEQGINAARDLIRTGEIGFVIIDSVASMVPERELSAETGMADFATKAKLMAQTMRQMTPEVQQHGVVCVWLNHLQEEIDSSPMGRRLASQGIRKKTTPGGRALKYHASMRLEFTQIGQMRTEEVNVVSNELEKIATGTRVKVTVVKNKVGPPFRSAEVRIRVGKGFSQAWSALDICVRHGLVQKRPGGTYRFSGELVPSSQTVGEGATWDLRGEENVVRAIEAEPLWQEALLAHARAAIEASGSMTTERPVGLESEDDPEMEELLSP